MTIRTVTEIPSAPTTAELKARFSPVFESIAAGTLEREQNRQLAYGAIEDLREAGFTRVRLPLESGGLGASLVQLLDLMVDLGEADSNLPQALHSHFLFTEILQQRSQGEISEWWLAEVANGKIFANAMVELPATTGGRPVRLVKEDSGQVRVDGDKYYSTGSLFADYILTTTKDEDGELCVVVVDADAPGIERVDDWNGIGQRLTASGTTRFNHVPVPPARTYELLALPGPFGAPFVFLILAAAQAGIAQAVLRDAEGYVRSRRRTYGDSAAELPAQDPVVQTLIGSIAAKAAAARHVVLGTAADFEAALEAVRGITDADDPLFQTEFSIGYSASAGAWSSVSELVLDAANLLFELGGASSLAQDKALDRHWRNARTLASQSPQANRLRQIGKYRISGTVPPLQVAVRDSVEEQAGK